MFHSAASQPMSSTRFVRRADMVKRKSRQSPLGDAGIKLRPRGGFCESGALLLATLVSGSSQTQATEGKRGQCAGFGHRSSAGGDGRAGVVVSHAEKSQ